MNENKICTVCKELKPTSEFQFSNKKKNILRGECKTCSSLKDKKRREESPEIFRSRARLYYEENKDGKIKNYRDQNQERLREYSKEYVKKYYKKNSESIKKKNALYRLKNKDKVKERSQTYREKNSDKIKEWRFKNKEKLRGWYSKEYKNNKLYRFSKLVRCAIRNAFRKNGLTKEGKTFNMLSYSPECLYKHLSRYLDSPCEDCRSTIISFSGFNFHIDHIKPISLATNKKEIIKLNELENLRLICSECNLKKGNSHRRENDNDRLATQS